MAQLRTDYKEFTKRNAIILALGPDGLNAYKRFWEQESIPYIGLPDVKSRISDLYYQEFNLLKLGRMPAVFVIDTKGVIRYIHYGNSPPDIPANSELFEVLDEINGSDKASNESP
jgi:peroxiredoxin Q/BCP